MGKPQAKCKSKNSNSGAKLRKTRRFGKMIDQVWDETQPEKAEATQARMTQPDEDLPGLGAHYCMHCSRHFISMAVLQAHLKTKMHKKRTKQLLKEKPWTAEDALGMAIDNGKRKVKQQADSPAPAAAAVGAEDVVM